MSDLLVILDQLDEARAEATPGPWTAATAPHPDSDETHAEYVVNGLRPDEGRSLWVTWAPVVEGIHEDVEYVIPALTGDGPTSEANAALIVAAVNAAPKLTAALRAVLELHPTVEIPGSSGALWCQHCQLQDDISCPTVAAITAALTPEATS